MADLTLTKGAVAMLAGSAAKNTPCVLQIIGKVGAKGIIYNIFSNLFGFFRHSADIDWLEL